MPYIITRSVYPQNKIDETVNKFHEVYKKYPPEEQTLTKTIIQSATKATKEGNESITVYEVDKANLGDALMQVITRMVEFRSIEGFEYDISTYLTVEEGLSTLG